MSYTFGETIKTPKPNLQLLTWFIFKTEIRHRNMHETNLTLEINWLTKIENICNYIIEIVKIEVRLLLFRFQNLTNSFFMLYVV